MTTTDTTVIDRRSRRQQTRDDFRPDDAEHVDLAAEREQLFLSLKAGGCVALTLLFLSLGIPGPAFVCLTIGVLLLSTSQPG
jgi:hypothetical protein